MARTCSQGHRVHSHTALKCPTCGEEMTEGRNIEWVGYASKKAGFVASMPKGFMAKYSAPNLLNRGRRVAIFPQSDDIDPQMAIAIDALPLTGLRRRLSVDKWTTKTIADIERKGGRVCPAEAATVSGYPARVFAYDDLVHHFVALVFSPRWMHCISSGGPEDSSDRTEQVHGEFLARFAPIS